MSASPATNPTDAISAALSQNWEEATRLNQLIIDEDPDNLDAYNRLAYAYIQQGNIDKAKKTYEAVLKKDQYNQIAQKNLVKLQSKQLSGGNGNFAFVSPLMFLEEPGKTKIIACVNPAPAKIIDSLSCGQEVIMKVKKHYIEIRNKDNIYLGALPDDISFKLSKYIEGGNEYKVVIRSTAKNNLTIFIREITRGKQFYNQPSFTSTNTFVASGATDDMTEKPDTTATGEESEEA